MNRKRFYIIRHPLGVGWVVQDRIGNHYWVCSTRQLAKETADWRNKKWESEIGDD